MNLNQWLWPVYATIYDTLLHSPLYRELVHRVITSLSLDSVYTLLDAGCGTGNLEQEILSSNFNSLKKIQAIDLSPQMLSIARKKSPVGVQFGQANLNQCLAYANNSFDCIAAIHVLYALSDPDLTLKEIYRVLKPNGVLVVADPRQGASVIKLIKANLPYLGPFQRIVFLLRMFPVVVLNLLITNAGKKGYYHFREKQDWEVLLSKIGFLLLSVEPAYGNQDYLITARKGE